MLNVQETTGRLICLTIQFGITLKNVFPKFEGHEHAYLRTDPISIVIIGLNNIIERNQTLYYFLQL